jgi:hypothetical protein
MPRLSVDVGRARNVGRSSEQHNGHLESLTAVLKVSTLLIRVELQKERRC